MKRDTMVMFDLDGTLWDSAQSVAESWNEVLQGENPSLPALTADDVHGVMGLTMKEISEVLFPEARFTDRNRVFDRCCRYEVEYLYDHPGVLYAGLRETLEELRGAGYVLAIVSNCQRGYIDAFLQGSGLGKFFADWEEWERTGRPKGENIRLVMARGGFDKAVYIGDTGKDQEAARVAGIPFIHAAYGFGRAENPEGVIRNITELPALMRRLDPQKT